MVCPDLFIGLSERAQLRRFLDRMGQSRRSSDREKCIVVGRDDAGEGGVMAISKDEYDAQLDFLLRLNHDSVTTRMHMGYGGAVETAFDRLLADAPPKKTRGSDDELWACVRKAKEAWVRTGVSISRLSPRPFGNKRRRVSRRFSNSPGKI